MILQKVKFNRYRVINKYSEVIAKIRFDASKKDNPWIMDYLLKVIPPIKFHTIEQALAYAKASIKPI